MKAQMVLSGHLPLFDCVYLWYEFPGLLPTTVHAYINHVLRVRIDTGIDILEIQTITPNKTVRSSSSYPTFYPWLNLIKLPCRYMTR